MEISGILGCSREHVTRCLESPAGFEMLDKLRRETQAAIFDPVQDQLQNYTKEAMLELWMMRNTVESEKLKKDILVDVLHMGGYRPHTNTDRGTEQLPTIVIGQQNIQINNPNDEPEQEEEQMAYTPVAVEEAPNAERTNGVKRIEPSRVTDSEGDTERFSVNEVWQGEHDLATKSNAGEGYEAGARWKPNQERAGQSAGRGERSRERERIEQFEPSFTNEQG